MEFVKYSTVPVPTYRYRRQQLIQAGYTLLWVHYIFLKIYFVNSSVVGRGFGSVPYHIVLDLPDPDPSLFVRIWILPSSSKIVRKTLTSTV